MYIAQMLRRYDGPFGQNMGEHHEAWMHPAVTIIITIIIAAVAVYCVRTYAQTKAQQENRGPLDIAKERFAKGEINKEELADIKKELK